MKLVMALFLYLVIITTVSTALGIIQSPVPLDFSIADPVQGFGGPFGGLLDALSSVLAPLIYVFVSLGAFIQLLTFNVQGIPPIVNVLMIVPIVAGFFYLIVKLIRGGG
ncbi:MAG: hypothetical protein FVQ79_07440 [Planctomycetes bacterium]|nr:hypothetical protein [Planctomycetota bacterium]